MCVIRTIDQAAVYLKEKDPGSAFTKTALRRLVVTGQIPSIRVGSKYLLNIEMLESFLGGNTKQKTEETEV